MHVVSVFGPFNSRALVEMSADQAAKLVRDGAAEARPSRVIVAAERDVEALRARSAELADSALAAMVVAMAYELEHPYNSATSKSACARALQEALRELRALAPPEEAKDGIDQLAEQRALRLAKTADLPRT